MSTRYLLRLATRFHDWGADGVLERLVAVFADAGWAGDVAWMRANLKRKPRAVAIARGAASAAAFAAQIVELLPRDPGSARSLSVGGDAPASWALDMMMAPYHAPSERLEGIDMLALDFTFAGDADAAALVASFTQIVDLGVAEWAALQETASDARLDVAVSSNVAFTSILFPCFAWCSYLGATILREFAVGRLRDLAGYRVEWAHRGGLLFVATPTPGESATPDGEQALIARGERFRLARA